MKCARHACRNQESTIRTVIENNATRKRLLRKLRLRWEDCVFRDLGTVRLEVYWRKETEYRNRWRDIDLKGWS